MSFHDDEISVEDSRPRDCYEFILPTVTYRLTSATRDVTIDGQTYRAGTIQRGEIVVSTATNEAALEISMLVSHAMPQRYLRGGIPPRRIDVNVYRKQMNSGEHVQIWAGRVTSMACEKHVAKFLVPARATDILQRRIPTITAGRDCPHILYEAGCNVDPIADGATSFRTVVIVDGATVTLDTAPDANDNWAQFGELIHDASGERMTIKSQIGAVIEMQLPIVDMVAGDAVQVRAGCDHTVVTCQTKFANQVNFGGLPQLPTSNPFVAGGKNWLGIGDMI